MQVSEIFDETCVEDRDLFIISVVTLINALSDDYLQSLAQFIRSIIGLEIHAAKEAFSEFLNGATLNADQQAFINRLIDFLCVKGTIDKRMLFDVPFTEINHEGITGVFPNEEAVRVINILDRINATVSKVM